MVFDRALASVDGGVEGGIVAGGDGTVEERTVDAGFSVDELSEVSGTVSVKVDFGFSGEQPATPVSTPTSNNKGTTRRLKPERTPRHRSGGCVSICIALSMLDFREQLEPETSVEAVLVAGSVGRVYEKDPQDRPE
jgi:hypothetical protein